MGIRNITFAPGEFYHLYNRGTDKRPIFSDAGDCVRFQDLLYLSNSLKSVNVRDVKRTNDSVYAYDRGEPVVAIGAYCLMPNHFHILLTPLVDDGVSRFMNKLGTSYSMYFNKKYDRTGTLFEGPFKAKHADSDVYLKYLYAYIHLNPVKLWTERKEEGESATEFLKHFKYSSLGEYAGLERQVKSIINPKPFPEYFTTAAEHMEELKEWLGYRELLNVQE